VRSYRTLGSNTRHTKATFSKSYLPSGSRSDYNLYELLVRDKQNSCEVNYIWYNYCVRLQKSPTTEFRRVFGATPEIDFHRSLQAYWENTSTKRFRCPSQLEVLYIGTLEVVKKIA